MTCGCDALSSHRKHLAPKEPPTVGSRAHLFSAGNLVMGVMDIDLLNPSKQAPPMDRKICLYLSLVIGLSLLATACSRHSTPQAGTRRSENSYPLKSSPASGIAITVPKPLLPADSSMQVTERPSPFLDPQSAEPPPKASTPLQNGIGAAQRSADGPAPGVRPFIPPPPLVSNLARRETDAALPSPPAVDAPAIKLRESPAFPGTVGSSATATYELPNPKGIHRIIHKLAGIGRQSAVTGGKDFVPPRPIHEIQFVLLPGSIPILAHRKKIDLKASVDASGRVTRVELLSPRDEELATLAGYAASHWSFSPAQLDEQPVPSEIILHFDFNGSPVPAKRY
jgi:hypothetical protein